jgi:hypothetical protein
VAAKFPANFLSRLGGKRSQRFGGRGITVGKTILATEEDRDGNQPQDFFIARFAVGEIVRKTIAVFAGTLNQYPRLPNEIVSDSLPCHNRSKHPVDPIKLAVGFSKMENAIGRAAHGARTSLETGPGERLSALPEPNI